MAQLSNWNENYKNITHIISDIKCINANLYSIKKVQKFHFLKWSNFHNEFVRIDFSFGAIIETANIFINIHKDHEIEWSNNKVKKFYFTRLLQLYVHIVFVFFSRYKAYALCYHSWVEISENAWTNEETFGILIKNQYIVQFRLHCIQFHVQHKCW